MYQQMFAINQRWKEISLKKKKERRCEMNDEKNILDTMKTKINGASGIWTNLFESDCSWERSILIHIKKVSFHKHITEDPEILHSTLVLWLFIQWISFNPVKSHEILKGEIIINFHDEKKKL